MLDEELGDEREDGQEKEVYEDGDDLDAEFQDWRSLKVKTLGDLGDLGRFGSSSGGGKGKGTEFSKGDIPRRGDKDFKPDGTRVQEELLTESRSAMYEALDIPRGHFAKNELVGVWMSDEHQTVVLQPRGGFFKDMGKSVQVGRRGVQAMVLDGIETVYLVERGSMVVFLGNSSFDEFLMGEGDEVEFDYKKRLALVSLSHLYCLVFGFAGGGELAKYQVYANLKRHGYLVQKFREVNDEEQEQKMRYAGYLNSKMSMGSIWTRGIHPIVGMSWLGGVAGNLVSILTGMKLSQSTICGNDHLKRQHYFDYTSVFQDLQLIPLYTSYDSLRKDWSGGERKSLITYNVWKPAPSFSKKNPPRPDFQICVVDTEKETFPSLKDIHGLFNDLTHAFPQEHTCKEPKKHSKKPNQQQTKKEIRALKRKERLAKLDPKIQLRNHYNSLRDNMFKYGTTNRVVILAIVQSGVINFMSLGEGDFALKGAPSIRLNQFISKHNHGIVYQERD